MRCSVGVTGDRAGPALSTQRNGMFTLTPSLWPSLPMHILKTLVSANGVSMEPASGTFSHLQGL